MEASPDAIGLDGGSQSSIRIFANGPDGRPLAGVTFRVDTAVEGVVQDFGQLSARSIVTGSDGSARVIYTAPVGPPDGNVGTCRGLPGTCVDVVATPTGTNFVTAHPLTVQIRLVPLGVILPPADTPTPAFTVTPTPVNFNVAATFDASTSCGGTVVGGRCSSNSQIVSYAWTFGDGGSGNGRVVTHTFSPSSSSIFTVTLTVTNDRGIAASATQTVSVGSTAGPTGDWLMSPTDPQVGETIRFNASPIQPAVGRQIVSYTWNWGDGTPDGSGVMATHVFPTSRSSFTVVLTVVDDAGGTLTVPHTLTIGSGAPTAQFTFLLITGTRTVAFDASASTAQGGATLTDWTWTFGDTQSGSGQTTTHTYTAAGTYTVRLTVKDSLGRTGSNTQAVTIP
jgi:PKD repeat protein